MPLTVVPVCFVVVRIPTGADQPYRPFHHEDHEGARRNAGM